MTAFVGPPAETEPGIGALTMGGLLEETAARHAEREAIAFHGEQGVVRLTYGELLARARVEARALIGGGVAKGTGVALLMGNRPDWVITAFAVALAGGVLVPLNTYLEAPELEFVLRHSDASVLLMQRRLAGHAYLEDLTGLCPELGQAAPGRIRSARLPSLRRVACLGIDREEGAVEPWTALGDALYVDDDHLDACAAQVSPADDAVVIYTSGTTATPKGILHGHRAAALQSWRFAQQLRLDQQVRTWSAFPFFWTAGFCMVMGATLAAGGCLVLQEVFEPGDALRLIEAERVTAAHAWPHQLARLEDHPDWDVRDLSSLRQVEAFTSLGRHKTVRVDDVWSPRSAYGLSETFTIVSSVPADTPRAQREGHQGRILPGNSVRILDPATGEALPSGRDGEIAVKGPTLMKGYLKTPPEEYLDQDGFFRTGDAGFVDERGLLHWTGRTSELIKTGGANVSPVEIEEALLRHPGLKAALAVGVPDPLLGQVVVVCAVAHDAANVDEEDVRGFLRGRIASYKIPRRVLFFEEAELSLTANAKVRGEPLRALAAGRLASEARTGG